MERHQGKLHSRNAAAKKYLHRKDVPLKLLWRNFFLAAGMFRQKFCLQCFSIYKKFYLLSGGSLLFVRRRQMIQGQKEPPVKDRGIRFIFYYFFLEGISFFVPPM